MAQSLALATMPKPDFNLHSYNCKDFYRKTGADELSANAVWLAATRRRARPQLARLRVAANQTASRHAHALDETPQQG
jgi:hypothetical protein